MKKKEITTYTVMTALLLLSGFILFRMDQSKLQQKMRNENRIRLDLLAEMIRYMEDIRESSRASYDAHLEKNLLFNTVNSDDNVTADEYPEQVPTGDNLDEPYSYLKNEEFPEIADQSFDGVLLLSTIADEQISYIRKSQSLTGTDITFDPVLIHDLLTGKPQIIKAAGSRWLCSYSQLENIDSVLIWLMPLRSLVIRSVLHLSLTLVSELIIFVTILTYFFSVLEYSQTHKLTKQQITQYHPKSLRRTHRCPDSIHRYSCFPDAGCTS